MLSSVFWGPPPSPSWHSTIGFYRIACVKRSRNPKFPSGVYSLSIRTKISLCLEPQFHGVFLFYRFFLHQKGSAFEKIPRLWRQRPLRGLLADVAQSQEPEALRAGRALRWAWRFLEPGLWPKNVGVLLRLKAERCKSQYGLEIPDFVSKMCLREMKCIKPSKTKL